MTRGFAGLLVCAIPVFSAVSPEACVGCHRAQTAAFTAAAMTHALEAGPRAAILQANPRLAVTIGPYSYQIVRNGSESIYSVTDGKETIRVPIEWAFGEGNAGQTYVFERDGKWYESRVSYFSALHGLDLTLGADAMPRDLTAAAGRLSTASEMRTCFNCHATNVAKSLPLSLSSMVEGVQCERCHGSADAHQASLSPMRHLGGLTTEEQLDFCGQCHRTWSQVSIEGPRGIGNVRFQPYRLTNSRCYDATDNRIRCTACHDPHRPLETSSSAYDARCTACHSKASAHVCRVASTNCVTCHMPRLELPGAHQKLTDHRIRIVRANEPYPD